MIFAHDIKLPEETEFAMKFNLVSDLFQSWKNCEGTEEEKNAKFEAFFNEKWRLEMGY